MNSKKCCDNCIHYAWYYDLCKLYNTKVDERQVCSSHQESQFLTCEECKYEYDCPVMWSYLNAACLVLQKSKSNI